MYRFLSLFVRPPFHQTTTRPPSSAIKQGIIKPTTHSGPTLRPLPSPPSDSWLGRISSNVSTRATRHGQPSSIRIAPWHDEQRRRIFSHVRRSGWFTSIGYADISAAGVRSWDARRSHGTASGERTQYGIFCAKQRHTRRDLESWIGTKSLLLFL